MDAAAGEDTKMEVEAVPGAEALPKVEKIDAPAPKVEAPESAPAPEAEAEPVIAESAVVPKTEEAAVAPKIEETAVKAEEEVVDAKPAAVDAAKPEPVAAAKPEPVAAAKPEAVAAGAAPSEAEVAAVVQECLNDVEDLSTVTIKQLRKQVEKRLGVDLTSMKAFIKEEVSRFLNDREAADTAAAAAPVNGAAKEEPKEEEEEAEDSDAGAPSKPKARKSPMMEMSAELAAVCGAKTMSRRDLMQSLWAYIKSNNLQNPKDKREVLCDEKLQVIMGRKKITMFQMNKVLVKHMWRPGTRNDNEDDDENDDGDEADADGEGSDENDEEERAPKPKAKRAAPKAKAKAAAPRFAAKAKPKRSPAPPKKKAKRVVNSENEEEEMDDSSEEASVDEESEDEVSSSDEESEDSDAPKRKKRGGGGKKKGKAKAKAKGDRPKREIKQVEQRLSPQLAAVVGAETMSRPQIVSHLWVYIRANNLQNPNDKREIICDDALKAVMSGEDTVTMFNMNKHITQHCLGRV